MNAVEQTLFSEPTERKVKMSTATAIPVRPKMPVAPHPPTPSVRKAVSFVKIENNIGHRVLAYGPGGIGKTTLATQLPGPVAFIDLDESLSRLKDQLSITGKLENIQVVSGVHSWKDLIEVLQADGWDGIKSIVIDTATKAEELAIEHTLQHTLQEGKKSTSIEGYGYGKGYGYVFDTFLPLLAVLDRHARAGRNVVLICHDCTSTVPNPAGEDWLRYEPRLQSPNSGKASIRLRVREWCDHVLFIGYDVSVDKEGKGKGQGTRTMYTSELPHCMAKSRTTQDQIMISADGKSVWEQVIK
jgi:hypothetical protein